MIIDKNSSTLYIHIWEKQSLDEIIELIKVNNISILIHDSTFEFFLFLTAHSLSETPSFGQKFFDNEIERFIEFVESNNIKVYFFTSVLGLPFDNYETVLPTGKILESNNINLICFPEIFTNITLASTKTYPQIYPKSVLFSNHNGRARPHRCWMIDMLAKHNLLDIGNVSWNKLNKSNYNFKYWNEQIIKLKDSYNDDNKNQYDLPDRKYKVSTFDLVSETSVDVIFYTEKTWKPIIRGKAFIIYGAPGINMQLKEYGYRLFENVIDYSFDSISDPLERAEAIAKQLKNLAKYPPEQIHQQLIESIQHNRAWIFNRADMSYSDIKAEVGKITGKRFFTSLLSFENINIR